MKISIFTVLCSMCIPVTVLGYLQVDSVYQCSCGTVAYDSVYHCTSCGGIAYQCSTQLYSWCTCYVLEGGPIKCLSF